MSIRMSMWTIALALALAAPAAGGEVTHDEAFEMLKGLEGRWEGSLNEPGGPSGAIEYRVTAGGNTVMEVMFPGTEHEMISMYFLDEGELRGKHYCAMGNQPEMKLDPKESSSGELRFVFAGGTNFDPAKDVHVHGGRIALKGERLEASFAVHEGEREIGANQFYLERAR